MTNILVTGAAGFVGQHFVNSLAKFAPDATIIGLDRRYPIPGCHEQLVCDLSEPQTLQTLQALDPIDYVVHLAAQSHVHFSLTRPDIYVQDNVLATSNLIQALASHASLKRFLMVSSCEVYGNTHAPATEDDRTFPRTPYAASKLAQESFALSAIAHQQLPTVVCRLFNNYGRGQQANRLIPRLTQALDRDRQFELTGDGSQIRDWVAVEDTCEALIRLSFEPKIAPGEIFNVTSEEVYSVRQIIDLFESASEKSILVNQFHKDAGHLEYSAGNGEKLRSVTGWAPARDLRSFIAEIAKGRPRSGE